MSHAVLRGEPTPAQVHLDQMLDATLRARGEPPSREARERVSMAQLMLHCLRSRPDFVFMINGATGKQFTNREILDIAIPLARKLKAQGLTEKTAMFVARDHERTAAVYVGLMLAGVLTYLTDPGSTKFELQHYMRLVEPSLVLCDEATQAVVADAAADATDKQPALLRIHTDQLLEYIDGHKADLDSYTVADVEPYSAALLLPTSGSTGMPKAAIFNHHAMVSQLPVPWMHYKQFPTPTQRAMLLTTPQWATFTILVTGCVVNQVSLVMSPKEANVENVLDMMLKCRPTWTFFGPPFAKKLANAATPDHFSSLETIITLGSKVTADIIEALKEKAPGANILDGYGITETHSFLTVTPPGAKLGCNGPCANIFLYKLVNSDGVEAATDEEGELYIKGTTIIKGYYKNDTELAESMTADGWFRTGDAFRQDKQRHLYYSRRIKFCFKYDNLLVSPEELEQVIGQVPGVAECVVSDSARGPAAAVVLRQPRTISDEAARRAIHHQVESTLSDHKRLRGGIAFVDAIPRTHTGKAHRKNAKELIQRLADQGICCY